MPNCTTILCLHKLMKCIFCKKDSFSSKSIEHVVPESFGNYNYTLPRGMVCDNCNNYFAREVEKPFLNLPEIVALRAFVGIPSKKGKIPQRVGFIDVDEFNKHYRNNRLSFDAKIEFPYETDELLLKKNKITSRFLAKVAYESWVLRLINEKDWVEEIINDSSWDAIRDYVRRGSNECWNYNIRRIYKIDEKVPISKNCKDYVNWESDFLFIGKFEEAVFLGEIFFVVIFFGMEYALNLMGDSIESYQRWLKENNNKCYLYMKKDYL